MFFALSRLSACARSAPARPRRSLGEGWRAFAIVIGCLSTAGPAAAQAPTVTSAAVSIPAPIAPPIAALMAPQVVTVTLDGATKLEFWFVKSIPMRAGTSTPTWSEVGDGTLVGALRLTSNWSDIRGFTLRPGVYTLRYAMQPQNGDHMGISPHREFLLPAPAAEDTTAEPIGYDGAVELAKKASRRAHPSSISLDPPLASGKPLSTMTTDFGLQSVMVRVPTSSGTPLVFGIVVRGQIDN